MNQIHLVPPREFVFKYLQRKGGKWTHRSELQDAGEKAGYPRETMGRYALALGKAGVIDMLASDGNILSKSSKKFYRLKREDFKKVWTALEAIWDAVSVSSSGYTPFKPEDEDWN